MLQHSVAVAMGKRVHRVAQGRVFGAWAGVAAAERARRRVRAVTRRIAYGLAAKADRTAMQLVLVAWRGEARAAAGEQHVCPLKLGCNLQLADMLTCDGLRRRHRQRRSRRLVLPARAAGAAHPARLVRTLVALGVRGTLNRRTAPAPRCERSLRWLVGRGTHGQIALQPAGAIPSATTAAGVAVGAPGACSADRWVRS